MLSFRPETVVDEVGIAENGGDADAGKAGRAADARKVRQRCNCLLYPLSDTFSTARIALHEVDADFI